MTITFHDVEQGTEEWLAARRGVLTASEMKLIVTPTLKPASNDKERAHLYELMAQRITGHVEPHFLSDDMIRGKQDEIDARDLYEKHEAPVTQVGFITNSRWGFTLGYSPDGLVGEHGAIECKSRRAKFQVETLCNGEMPIDYMIQCQTGMLVAERQWIDFLSYSGGLPMPIIRIEPDPRIQDAILAAAEAFEKRLVEKMDAYLANIATLRTIPTERRAELEMI